MYLHHRFFSTPSSGNASRIAKSVKLPVNGGRGYILFSFSYFVGLGEPIFFGAKATHPHLALLVP